MVKKPQVLVKYDYGPGIAVRLRWLKQTVVTPPGECYRTSLEDG